MYRNMKSDIWAGHTRTIAKIMVGDETEPPEHKNWRRKHDVQLSGKSTLI